MHDLALHQHFLALGRRPQIRAVQRAADVAEVPEALLRGNGDGDGGANVEDQRDGAAVQRAGHIAQRVRDRHGEGRCGVVRVRGRRVVRCGEEC